MLILKLIYYKIVQIQHDIVYGTYRFSAAFASYLMWKSQFYPGNQRSRLETQDSWVQTRMRSIDFPGRENPGHKSSGITSQKVFRFVNL